MTTEDRWPPDRVDDPGRDPREAGDEATDARLLARLRDLPLSVEPPRDLWPGIAARLEEPVAPRRPRRAALFAAGLAAALVAAFVAGRWSGTPAPQPTAPPVEVPAVTAAALSVPPNLAAASESLERTRRELEIAFRARRGDLPPETLAVLERNLDTIGAAIAEIELALDSHPSDPQLGRRLVAYKTRQIALLEQAQRAAARL